MSVNGKVNHLLNWVEVWIIQVPQKPQNTRSEHLEPHKNCLVNLLQSHEPPGSQRQLRYLSQEQNEGGKVEDVDHAHQPVEEHASPRSRLEALRPVLQGGVKHLLRAVNKHLTARVAETCVL